MPQTSPMKWMMLNLIVQSSILQISSLMSSKKTFNKYIQTNNKIKINKLSWKW